MLQTLEEITQRLVDRYEPERIIVFGSRATGNSGVESDIDLLVIKDTAQGPIDRRCEVERLLGDRGIALDLLVYTPREIWDLYLAGSPLIEAIVETGQVLYMRKITESWQKNAEDEYQTASLLFDHRRYRASCYHSQQCVEKALKAPLLEKGHRPPRTHDLVELRTRVRHLSYTIAPSTDDAAFLNSIYRGRYPSEEGLLPAGEPTESHARRALDGARAIVDDLDRILRAGE